VLLLLLLILSGHLIRAASKLNVLSKCSAPDLRRGYAWNGRSETRFMLIVNIGLVMSVTVYHVIKTERTIIRQKSSVTLVEAAHNPLQRVGSDPVNESWLQLSVQH
jgi:hypothetical protein